MFEAVDRFRKIKTFVEELKTSLKAIQSLRPRDRGLSFALSLYVYVSRAKQGVRQGPRAGRIVGIVVVNSKTCC